METDTSRILPEFGEVEISSLPDGTALEDIKSLQSLYREHCEVREKRHSHKSFFIENSCLLVRISTTG